MLDLKCPKCDGPVNVFLESARIVWRTIPGRQWRSGSQSSYQHLIPRGISWNCLNEECEQRKGHPEVDNRTKSQKLRDKTRQKLEKLDFKRLLKEVSDKQEENQ